MRLPTVPGLDITLSVHRKDLKEYDDEESSGTHDTLVKYVEAVSGANFAVEFRTDRRFTWRYNDLEIKIYLDGAWAEAQIFTAQQKVGGHSPKTISGGTEWRDGQAFSRKFIFADLKTTDAPPKAGLKEKLANIGEVSIKIYRIRKLGTVPASSYSFKSTVGTGGVPEKALKGRAISSHATLGAAVPAAIRETVRVEYPWGRDPFATFTFKYRSYKDLQIEGLIPRSPSPVPLEDRDPDTLSAEEARELVRIQRQKLQDQAKIKKEKREREEDEEDEGDEVEVFAGRTKRQRRSNDSGIEVVDLSNEIDEDDF